MPGTRKLGRPTDHRRAMLRAMVTYLLENGKIETTVTRYNFGMQFIFAAIALGLLMLGNIIRRIKNRREGEKIGIVDAFHYGEEGHFSHIPHNH